MGESKRRAKAADFMACASDHCGCCGRAYRSGDKTVVGHDTDNKLINVGECCASQIVETVAVGAFMEPLLDYTEDDRVWFERNPDRDYRWRPAYPNEFGGVATRVVVRQFAPGVRVRKGIKASLPADAPEAVARITWATGGGQLLSVSDVLANLGLVAQ